MRYTVTWSPFAQDQLADLWLTAADRDAVTRALRDDPDTKGFPFGGDRMLVAGSLRVVFVVRPDDRAAEVIEVW